MKKLLFILLTLCMSVFTLQVSAQQIVEIGDGGTTTNSYLPFYSFYNNTLSEQIYTPDEVTMGGTISSIAFYNGGTEKSPLVKIYMINTDQTQFSSTTDWFTVTASDLVFQGTVSFTANAWTTITLDTPFDYDGVSNLGLIFDANLEYSSGFAGRVFTSTNNCAMYVYSDPTDYDAVGASYSANSRLSVKNQIKLEIMPNGSNCFAPASPAISDVDAFEATLSWTPRDGQTAWEVYCGTGVIDLDQVTWTAVTDTFYTFTTLAPATTYTAYVRTNCGTEVSNPRQVSFTTEATCASVPSGVTVSNITATTVDVSWTAGTDDSAWEVVVVPSNATPESGIPEQTNDNPYTVTNLQDNTQYKVYVRTDCGGGDHSYWSTAATFTTHPFCSSPLSVTISQITATSALVTWEPAVFGATSYTVEYSLASEENWAMELVDGTQYMISNLEPDSSYNVMVYSNCDLGTADTVHKNFTTKHCLVGGDLQIGEGTSTTSYFPTYSCYNYSYTQQIFLSSEMNGASNIHSIAFDVNSIESSTRQISIYMMHTTAANSDWLTATNAQMVFSGTVNLTLGWNTFNFTTPFEYNGTSNLALIVIDATGDYSCSNYYNCHTASATLSHCQYQDGGPYSINTNPSSTGGSSSTSADRCNVIFGIDCDETIVCARPNVYITETSESSITIDWAPGYTESAWEVEYSVNDTDWTAAGNVTSHPYEVAGLDPDTRYTIRVRSNCGSEYSDWSAVASRTACSAVAVPYFEDFDNAPGSGSGNMITCWTRNTNYSTAYPYTSSSQHFSGNYSVYFYGNSTSYSYLASPLLDNVQMDNLQVRFWARKSTASYYIQVGIMEDPNDYSTFVQVGTNLTPDTINTWQLLQVNTDNYTGSGQYIAFRIPADISSYMYIDDVNIDYIPSCEHVSNITTVSGSVTANSADLAWTEGGTEGSWDVVYGISGTITNPDEESATTVQSPSISLTNLNSNTLYDVYVKAVCSGSESSIWMPYTFRTECGVITTIPFTNDFEEYNTGSSSPIYCWTRHNTYSTSDYPYVSNSYAFSGSKSLYFYHDGSSYAMIATPAFDQAIDFSNLQVSFMMRSSSASSAKMIVGMMADPTDPTTFDPIDTITVSASNTWEPIETSLSSYTGAASHIALKSLMSGYYSIYVDNFVVEEIPSCPKPSNVTAASGATDTIVVSWTDPTGNLWDIIYGPTGFDPTETPDPDEGITLIEGVTDNPYILTDLEGGIVYDIYVRSNCGGDVSPWSTIPASATPFLVQMGTVGSATISGCGLTVTDDGGLNGSYSNNCDYTLTINPSEPNNLVSISGTFAGESTLDYLSIYEGTSTSGTLLQKVTSGTSGTVINFGPLTSESGPLTLLFHSDGSVVYPGFSAQVSCIEMTGCPRPTNFTVSEITGSSVTLSWMGPEDASAWNVAYGPSPFTVTSDTQYETVYDTTITIDELTAGTSYDFYVQADCGSEPSAWRGPITAAPGVFTFGTTGSSSITACDLTIYDNGGPNGNYTAYCDYTLIVYPSDPDSVVSISGTFAGESTIDYLSVYEGTSTSGTLLQKITSGSSGTVINFGPLTSESGPLTLYFHSDGSVQYAGFAATVSCVEAPDCRTPYGLTANNITADEATITWTAEQGANIELYYKKNSESTWTVVTSSDFTTENSCLLTNLDPATTYSVYVANICTDTTLTTATITFTTLCSAVTAPYSENFAGFNTAVSPCWERFTGLASSVFNGGALTASTGGWSFSSSNVFPIGHPKVNIYGTSCNYWLVSPSIDLSQLSDPALMFSLALTDYYNEDPIEDPTAQADDQFMVVISTDNGTTWSAANATVWNNTTTGDYVYNTISTTGEDITISLSQYAGQTIRIAFYGESTQSGGDNDLHIANVVVNEAPSCMRPTNITVSDINTTSATLSWNAGGDETSWNIAYGVPGFDPNNTTDIIPVSSNPFTLTGLNALTQYEVYVQADCGGGDMSLWTSNPVSFATAACDITDQCEYVFVCTDGYGDGWNGASITVQQNGVSVATVEAINHSMSSTTTVDTIRVMLCDNVSTTFLWNTGSFDDEADVTVIGPDGTTLYNHTDMETITSDTLLAFTTDCSGSGPVVTDPTVATNAATSIAQTSATLNATITNPSGVTITAKGFEWKQTVGGTYTQIAGTGTGNTFTANLTTLIANTGYTYKAFITFNGTTVYGDEMTFTTTATPVDPCDVPTNVTTSNVTYNAADVTWNAGTANAWNVQYKEASASAWGNSIAVTAATYHISGLNAETAYQVRVQANCGNGNLSDWTAPVNFTTEAEPVEPCDAPTNLDITNITPYTATMSWTAGGTETAWKVGYKLSTASQWQEATVQQTTYEIEGLTPESTYDVRVKAVCAADNESDFITSTFTTIPDAINEVTLAQSISLMPNPADNYIELRVNSNVVVKEVVVYNAFGQTIQTVNLTDNHARIDLSNVSSGMYFVRVNGDNVSATKKFIRK